MIIRDANFGDTGPPLTGGMLAIAPLALEVEDLVDRLEADLRQGGTVSAELANHLHELKVRAERLLA